jgi:predicted acetyltransferase
MSGSVYLVKPSVEWQQAYLSYYEEWIQSGGNIVPWVVQKDPQDFAAYVQFLIDSEKEEHVPAGWVPHSTYWLLDTKGQIVGVVNIRHWLTEYLLNQGGHIGYGIRPSERRKGYATAILALALDKTKELGMERVLVTCDHDNVGSERAIVNNRGVLESEFTEENGNVVRRFWIDLLF